MFIEMRDDNAPISVSTDYPPHGEDGDLKGISNPFLLMPLPWGTSE